MIWYEVKFDDICGVLLTLPISSIITNVCVYRPRDSRFLVVLSHQPWTSSHWQVARQRIRHKPGKNQKHTEKTHKEKRQEKKAQNNAAKGNGQQKSPQQQLYKSNSPAVLIIQKVFP